MAIGLLLEEFGEVGNLVGDGVGTVGVLGWGFDELAYSIGMNTLNKDGLDACSVLVWL